jgi:predicted PhzF superfamily epimerase YddE/YHI9
MQIYQIDAFAKELFQGNPAAVVPLEEWLPDDLMQRIAMENNLAETAFFIPEGDDFVIRWFTPTTEVDLCGHATLASGHVLFEHLGYNGDLIRFRSLKSGLLAVSRGNAASGAPATAPPTGATTPFTPAITQPTPATGATTPTTPLTGAIAPTTPMTVAPTLLTLNFPAGAAQPVDPAPLATIFEALGISPYPLFKGPFDYMVVLDDPGAVSALRPDFQLLATAPARGVVVTAPGVASRPAAPKPGSGASPGSVPNSSSTPNHASSSTPSPAPPNSEPPDFVSRCFFPQSGIDEDPVTGSAHTMLVPYWAARLGKQHLTAIQLSARRGYLDCRLDGDRVYISGYAKTFMKGEILL